MFTFTIILMILVCLLLVIFVLLQNSKSEGMSVSTGSSGFSKVMGLNKTSDILEKTTWILISIFFLLTIVSGSLISKKIKKTGTNIEIAKNTLSQMEEETKNKEFEEIESTKDESKE